MTIAASITIYHWRWELLIQFDRIWFLDFSFIPYRAYFVSTWHKAPVAPGFLARRVAPELQLARLSEGDEKLEELWAEAPVEMDIGIHQIWVCLKIVYP